MNDKRTYSSRAEYLKKAVAKRRKAIKIKALSYMGKQCLFCQYDKYVGALEFHHKISVTKEFGIAQKGYTRAWVKIQEELDKCILVCSNCHKEVHAGIRSLPE